MEQKNKFDAFDKPDEFDKMLFDYYDNKDEEIPLSTQKAIENAFKDKNKEKSTTIIMLKRVAVFILCLGIVTATSVYAKDIINFITSIFTNSNPGIDKAVDNGYVQNVDMDFITYNDVGVKADYILMDDKNLNISFVYKYFDENITFDSLTFSNLTITDEQDNYLCVSLEKDSDIKDLDVLGDSIRSVNEPELIDATSVRESLLVSSKGFPNSQVLYIKISRMTLVINNEIKYIDGNWNFSINLNDYFVKRESNEYHATSSPYIDCINASLTNTSLDLEILLNTQLDNSIVLKRSNIVLTDENGTTYKYTKVSSGNNIEPSKEYISIITLSYPITTYDNINKLFLHINLDLEKSLDIELSK